MAIAWVRGDGRCDLLSDSLDVGDRGSFGHGNRRYIGRTTSIRRNKSVARRRCGLGDGDRLALAC